MSFCNVNTTGQSMPTLINWGNIRGSLTSQTDLWNFLETKATISTLAAVAFSGDYLDLKNKPIIPSIVPGGSNGDVQFNNSGSFGGNDNFQWTSNNNLLIGSSIDNLTGRLQVLDSTGQNQLALHFDASNYYVQFLVDGSSNLSLISSNAGGLLLTDMYLSADQGIYMGTGTFLSWGPPLSFTTNLGTYADGSLVLLDSTQSAFNLLQFGGVTSSYPAIKRNGVGLEVKLADDSSYSSISANALILESVVLGGIVNGKLQTDGTNLYFDIGGVRKTVTLT